MELDEVQIAGLARALATLEAIPDYEHPMALLRRLGGSEVVEAINILRTEYVAANKVAKSGGVALLSADAAEYWQEAQGVLAYGRLVMSMGSRAAEKALSRKCEALEESFTARVPLTEQGRFLVHDINGGNWDDRWHSTVDFSFPLLRPDLGGGLAYQQPMAEAQRTVLSAIVRPVPDAQVQQANVERRSNYLRELARGETLALAKLQKEKAKEQASEDRKAKIAAGDQKATKRIRKRDYKIVTDLFDDGSGR